jgi:hypothetical protein
VDGSSSSSSQPGQQLAHSQPPRQQQGVLHRSSKASHAPEPITLEQLIAMTQSRDLTHGKQTRMATSSSSLAAMQEPVVCGSPRAPFPQTVSSQLSQRLLLLDGLLDPTTSVVAAAGGEADGTAGSAYCGTFSPVGGSPRVSFQGTHARPPPAANPPGGGPSNDAGPSTLAAAPSSRPLLISDLLLRSYRHPGPSQLGPAKGALEPATPDPRATLHSSSSSRSSGGLGADGVSGMVRAAAAAEAYHQEAAGRAAVCSSSSSSSSSHHAAGQDVPVRVAALGRAAAAAGAGAAGAQQEVFGSPPLSAPGVLIPVRALPQGRRPPAAAACPPTPYCSPHVAAAGGRGPAEAPAGGVAASDLQQLLEEVEAELATSPATPAMVRARHLLRRVAAAAQQQQQGSWAVVGQGPDVAQRAPGEADAVGGGQPWSGECGFTRDHVVEEPQGLLGGSRGSNAMLLQALLQGGPDAFHPSDSSSWNPMVDYASKARSVPEQLGAHTLSHSRGMDPLQSGGAGSLAGPLTSSSATPGPHATGGGSTGDRGLLMEAWGLGASCSGGDGSRSSSRAAGPLVGDPGLAVSRCGPGLELPEAVQVQHNQTGSAALATYADMALLEALDLSPPCGGASWEGPLAAQSIWQDMLQELQQQEYTTPAASGGGGWGCGGSVPAFEHGRGAPVQAAGMLPGMHVQAVEQQQVSMDPNMLLLCQQLLQGGCGVEAVGPAQLSQQPPPAARPSRATSNSSSSSRQLLLELLSGGSAPGSGVHGAATYMSGGADVDSCGGGGGGGLGAYGYSSGGRVASQVLGATSGHRSSLERQQQQQVLATSKLLASLAVPPE